MTADHHTSIFITQCEAISCIPLHVRMLVNTKPDRKAEKTVEGEGAKVYTVFEFSFGEIRLR